VSMKIGVIADTHGLMRPEALEALRGSDLILHAGDIGKPTVIEALQAVASVVAVRGNNDNGSWADSFADTEVVQADSMLIYTLHDLAELDLDPGAANIGVVVSGHSHTPIVETRRGVLYLNPGSAGPRRFRLPISVARLTVAGDAAHAELVYLDRGDG
jgi:uncharacterized protein